MWINSYRTTKVVDSLALKSFQPEFFFQCEDLFMHSNRCPKGPDTNDGWGICWKNHHWTDTFCSLSKVCTYFLPQAFECLGHEYQLSGQKGLCLDAALAIHDINLSVANDSRQVDCLSGNSLDLGKVGFNSIFSEQTTIEHDLRLMNGTCSKAKIRPPHSY